jgi:hypothetical protein
MSSYINGPFNYVQLTGNVKDIPKNITIFMDVHLDINNQTRCESFNSIDISQYLYNLIKESNIQLDFFLEVREEQLKQPQTDKRDIYIAEVIEMFKSEFIVEKDKVKYSKSNENVRLHYLDIRDHLKFNHVIKLVDTLLLPKLKSLKNDKLTDSDKINILEQIKTHVENIKEYMMNIIENEINIKNYKLSTFDKKTQEYYLDKIIHKYTHKTVKKNINNYLNKFFLKYVGETQKLSGIFEYIIKYKIDIKNSLYLVELIKLCNIFRTKILTLYGVITDVYFLRRFLDKDYIQNVITYCGRNHALNYIYFLVKYYDFKIINIYNTNGLTIDDITNKIKHIEYVEDNDLNMIYNLFLFEDEKPKQCVEKPTYDFFELGW